MSTKQVYRNGIWTLYESTTHERVAPFAPIVFHEEFKGTTLVAGTTIWTAHHTETLGTPVYANVADQHGGVFSLALDVTGEEQEAGLTWGDQLNFNLDKGFVIEFVAALHVLPTALAEVYFGVGGNYVAGELAAADNGPLIHAAFMFDGSGACTIHTDDGATDNDAIATGVTVLVDAQHVFQIDFTTITDVLFFIDGVNVGSATTFDMSNGTNVVIQPYLNVYKSAGAGLGDLYVDSVRVWSKR